MNQILSVIMVIVMAFSSMAGVTAGIEDAVSFDASISFDALAVLALSGDTGTEVPEETLQSMKVAGDILDALTLKGVATKDAAELDVIAGEKDVVLSIGMKTDEKGAVVASSLLPSDVIFVSAETLEKMKQEMMQSIVSGNSGVDMTALQQLQGLDKEQIQKDAGEVSEKLIQAIEAKKGETETGEFTVDELAFSAKTRINMTYVEFTELLLTSVKELAAKDSLKPLLQTAGTDFEAEIDKAIEQVKNQPESDYPELFELTVYTNADNGAYYVCDMVSKAAAEGAEKEQLHIAFGDVDGLNRTRFTRVQGKENMDITSTGVQGGAFDMHATAVTNDADMEINAGMNDAGNLDMVCTVKNTQPNAKIVVHTEAAEGDRTAFTLALFAADSAEPVMQVKGSAGKGGEALSVYEGETINIIPIETLMDSQNQTAATLMQTKLLAGLMKSVTVIIKNVPEDTGAWLTEQLKQAMSPKTTAAPAE